MQAESRGIGWKTGQTLEKPELKPLRASLSLLSVHRADKTRRLSLRAIIDTGKCW
jgi:hypothetical protein